MAAQQPRILFVRTYYPEFVDELYRDDPTLADLAYDVQLQRLFDTAFATGDAYSHELRALGCETCEIIVNADRLQQRWATDHGVACCSSVHDRRREIAAAQIRHFRPDVLYVFEWCPLGEPFLAAMKSDLPLLVGQIASPLRDDRTYAAYDLMISSWPPIVDHFRREGMDAESLTLGFDTRILDRLIDRPPRFDVSFVGGFAPSHPDRIAWLERLLIEIDVDVFGYGLERTGSDSAIRSHHRGLAWGRRMYDVLHESRITLNRHAHIDVRGAVARDVANNMRLYEATGVGTCLITDAKANLPSLFDPGCEIVSYEDDADCIAKIRYLLGHEREREAIALAGRKRTLRDHTHAARMSDLLAILEPRLR